MSSANAAQPPRKKRFGSDTAGAWARNLRLRVGEDRGGKWVWLNTGIPAVGAKAVLLALTQYVDEFGQCYPSLETLGDDTDQSAGSARRRLADLEAIGVLARFARIRDENGALHISPTARGESENQALAKGIGRQTSDLIRLNFNISQDEIDRRLRALVKDGTAPDHDEDEGEISPHNLEGQNDDSPANLTGQNEPVNPANLAGGGSHSCESHNVLNPHLNQTPQAPQRGVEVDPEGWKEFQKIWESDGVPIAKPSLAKDRFAALTETELAKVPRAARGYLHHRSREKKPGQKIAAQNFLREVEAFDGWAKLAPPEPVVTVEWPKGSPEFRALATRAMLAWRDPIKPGTHALKGPEHLGPQTLALAAFATDEGVVDRSQWIELDSENPALKNQIGAWRNFIKDKTGIWVEFEEVEIIGPDGNPVVKINEWNGKELVFKQKRKSLLVPAPWPPRKDGSLGPPKESSDAA